jgi:HlyD family secretion protein
VVKELVELFPLLSKKQRRGFYKLQLLVIIMALVEMLGIASIGPFMSLVGNSSVLQGDGVAGDLYRWSHLDSEYQFIAFVGVAVFCMLMISTAVSMFTTWRMSLFGVRLGTEISDRLYEYYVSKSWEYHANTTGAYLTKQIQVESGRLTNQVIRPFMLLNSRLVLTLFIVVALISYDPVAALSAVAIIGWAYFTFYYVFNKKLKSNGENISISSTQRFRLMNDAFGGIKDLLLMHRQHEYVRQFKGTSNVLCGSISSNAIIGQLPRYLIELMAFGSLIIFTVYLLVVHKGNLGAVLPVLTIYALAGYKLLPAFQQIYGSLVQIKAGLASYRSIKEDLLHSSDCLLNDNVAPRIEQLPEQVNVSLENITFKYKSKPEPAVRNVSLEIPYNKTIGFVGTSGSGKSTLIDIIVGLLTPQQGSILFNGKKADNCSLREWQDRIGLVSQFIYLSEGSVIENVAFGVPVDQTDLTRVKRAIELAHLDEFLAGLPDGYETRIGERGVQLSGGQRQRLGIARALYHDASVLVFDEATSALDGITEKLIMEAINDFSGKKTIILIAHRLNTVKNSDQIYIMEAGAVADYGTYGELVDRNQFFSKLAENA